MKLVMRNLMVIAQSQILAASRQGLQDARLGRRNSVYNSWVWNPEKKRTLGRLRCKWGIILKWIFFITCDVLDSAQRVQNRVQSQTLLNTTVYLAATLTFGKQNTGEKIKLRLGIYFYLSCVAAGSFLISRVNNNNNNNNNNVVYIGIFRP